MSKYSNPLFARKKTAHYGHCLRSAGIVLRFGLAFLTLFLVAAPPTAQAQNPSYRKVVNTADEAFAKKDFYKAFKLYEAALKYDKDDTEVLFKYALAALEANSFWNAKESFQKVVDSRAYLDSLQTGEVAEPFITTARLYLADMMVVEGELSGSLDEAENAYNNFLSMVADNLPARYREQALQGLRNVEQARNIPISQDTLVHLDEKVNTPYMEFSPVRRGDTLYYASYRFEDDEDNAKPPRKYFRIMQSVNKEEGTLVPGLDHPGKHTGHPSFSADGRRIYYTVCDFHPDPKKERVNVRCDIYFRDRRSDGSWGRAVAFQFNDPEFNTAQPMIATYDFVDNFDVPRTKNVLFFVSNRGGGEDLDIYYAHQESDTLFTPPLPANINTRADDISPYYSGATKTLYFSSRGYASVGRFDIFKATGTPANLGTPEALEYPNNTSYDDIYFSLTEDEMTAYLASNRLIPEGDSVYAFQNAERCCHDIFEVKRNIPPTIQILVNCCGETPVTDALVQVTWLRDYAGQEGAEAVAPGDCKDAGLAYCYPAELGSQYRITIEKNGFTSVDTTIRVDVGDLDMSRNLNLAFSISQMVRITVFDIDNNEPVNGATLTFFDAAAGIGRPIFQTTATNNEFEFPACLQEGRSYVISATHPDYEPTEDYETLDRLPGDYVCTPLGLDLFMKPLCPYPDTTPVQVFFDNDYPLPKTWAVTTSLTYGETYTAYTQPDRIQTFVDNFVNEFSNLSENLKAEFDRLEGVSSEAISDADRMRLFFENTVDEGKLQLDNFVGQIAEVLDQGESVVIEIRGFASPKYLSNYNTNLSRRRIVSVENHFREGINQYFREKYGATPSVSVRESPDYGQYTWTIDKPYGRSTTQICFIREPNGDGNVPKPIEDVLVLLEDTPLARYSGLASQERRVEIRLKEPTCVGLPPAQCPPPPSYEPPSYQPEVPDQSY